VLLVGPSPRRAPLVVVPPLVPPLVVAGSHAAAAIVVAVVPVLSSRSSSVVVSDHRRSPGVCDRNRGARLHAPREAAAWTINPPRDGKRAGSDGRRRLDVHRPVREDRPSEMIGRYSIVRGAPASSLPSGVRQDTRKHTRHPLRPTKEMVERVLARPDDDARWESFAREYAVLLADRFATDRGPFDALAELARETDVWLGCNCPTAKNPDVRRCHTALALRFLQARYPDLDVRLP
jgi:hypothetical protein